MGDRRHGPVIAAAGSTPRELTTMPAALFALVVVLVVATSAALYLWSGVSYRDYSDGVYAYSARAILRGAAPYQDFAAAQPPLFFYLAAGLLFVGDGIDGLRALLGAIDVALGVAVAATVWRLCGSRPAAVASGVAALLTPWALHEHALLTPETFAAMLLLAGALATSRSRWALAGGFLLALAVACKLAFIVPAVLVAVVCGARRRALAGLVLALIVMGIAAWLAFGTSLWDDLVVAQRQVGFVSLHYLGGLWLQALWNLAPLLVGAALAVWFGRESRDPELLRVVVALALGTLILVATLAKRGSYLNVLVVAEPALLVLGACGLTWMLRAAPLSRELWALRGVVVVFAALAVAETVSLLADPGDPRPFARPLAASAPGWEMSSEDVDRAAAAIRHCAPALAYGGPPYLAFIADRRMPGGQPDQFLLRFAPAMRRFAEQAVRDRPRCTAALPR